MFEFAWAWMFLLAPLPWLARWLLPPADTGEAALKVSFLHELEQHSGRRALIQLPPWRRQIRFVGIWLLLLCAAARPQFLDEPLPVPSSGRDLLIAVDVSGSMAYADMQLEDQDATRLEVVKHLFGDFIEERQGDRVGLILFGSQPYLQSPLTFDRNTVRTWLDEALIGIAGNTTAIGDAIGLAIKQLRLKPADSRVLILITDGANNGGQIPPLIAARLAAEQQIRIYTIGIGANPGSTPGQFLGLQRPALDLDEPTLQAIADTTGGEYFRASNSQQLQSIEAAIDRLEPISLQAFNIRPAQALFAWPLALALCLSLLWTLRHVQPQLHWRTLWMRARQWRNRSC